MDRKQAYLNYKSIVAEGQRYFGLDDFLGFLNDLDNVKYDS